MLLCIPIRITPVFSSKYGEQETEEENHHHQAYNCHHCKNRHKKRSGMYGYWLAVFNLQHYLLGKQKLNELGGSRHSLIREVTDSRTWGIFIQDHWITMKYAVSCMKMPHVWESATSLLCLFFILLRSQHCPFTAFRGLCYWSKKMQHWQWNIPCSSLNFYVPLD